MPAQQGFQTTFHSRACRGHAGSEMKGFLPPRQTVQHSGNLLNSIFDSGCEVWVSTFLGVLVSGAGLQNPWQRRPCLHPLSSPELHAAFCVTSASVFQSVLYTAYNCKCCLYPTEVEIFKRVLPASQPRHIFLKDLKAVPLKCSPQGRWCPVSRLL